jgi:lipoprotein NlpD
MSKTSYSYLFKSSLLFVILNTCVLLTSCVSHSAAPVYDKSNSSSYRPAAHIVIPGDTLFSIAWRYGLKYESLAKSNGISKPYVIRPGQVIHLTAGKSQFSKSLKSPVQANSNNGRKVPVKSTYSSVTKTKKRPEFKAKSDGRSTQIQSLKGAPLWRWPVSGVILSAFKGSTGLNKGIDLAGKLGEPVLAAATGQVVYSGSGLRGYGKLLIVKHNENYLSAYAHNDRLLVKEGDLVKAGQRIADMGSSGTDRVKLHFEIRRDGTPVDPVQFLPRR